jgi:aldehyde dehydrogenase (NAD+)
MIPSSLLQTLTCRSNNEWVASSSKETFETVNPATGKHLIDVAHATKEDVDTAVKAARQAFKTTWGLKIPGSERGALLLKLADLMERDQDKLAAVESLNGGKGIRVAK